MGTFAILLSCFMVIVSSSVEAMKHAIPHNILKLGSLELLSVHLKIAFTLLPGMIQKALQNKRLSFVWLMV
ncbi:hypothetical protein HOLleu_02406 [Holothuria leucospilota]|uniref:Uncharacterized protein n=1 Tax=Holothuria leucospilota TaxID=206669 RepID=A0A9Q1CR87_HOLLE|nr:hypothetical protein HOLleu_02406 [Holothuria leucospilota]